MHPCGSGEHHISSGDAGKGAERRAYSEGQQELGWLDRQASHSINVIADDNYAGAYTTTTQVPTRMSPIFFEHDHDEHIGPN